MRLGFGTAAGATDIAGQRAVLRHGGTQKERVIVPWPGVGTGWFGGFPVPTLGCCSLSPIIQKAQSGLQLGLVHRFWTILG
jgi:hypothetical protein